MVIISNFLQTKSLYLENIPRQQILVPGRPEDVPLQRLQNVLFDHPRDVSV